MTIKRTKTGRPAARAKRRLRPIVPKVARARSSDAGNITSKPMLIGYARVSTVDQNLALQRDALTEAGCAKIFTEQMSGAVAARILSRRCGTEVRLTHRWREPDSNHQSR